MLNSTPEPEVSIAMCVITATTICMPVDLATWLKKGKVIAMRLWTRCKDRLAVAASGWIFALWNLHSAAESG